MAADLSSAVDCLVTQAVQRAVDGALSPIKRHLDEMEGRINNQFDQLKNQMIELRLLLRLKVRLNDKKLDKDRIDGLNLAEVVEETEKTAIGPELVNIKELLENLLSGHPLSTALRNATRLASQPVVAPEEEMEEGPSTTHDEVEQNGHSDVTTNGEMNRKERNSSPSVELSEQGDGKSMDAASSSSRLPLKQELEDSEENILEDTADGENFYQDFVEQDELMSEESKEQIVFAFDNTSNGIAKEEDVEQGEEASITSTPSATPVKKKTPNSKIVKKRKPKRPPQSPSKPNRKHASTKAHVLCTVCGGLFRDQFNLTRHQKVHQRDGQFRCGKCNAAFHQISHLTVHEKQHQDEEDDERNVCASCGEKFSTQSAMKAHFRRAHTTGARA